MVGGTEEVAAWIDLAGQFTRQFGSYNRKSTIASPTVDTKMRIPSSKLSVLVAVCALSGCASGPQGDIAKPVPEITIYNTDQLPAYRYDVVRRIWVDSWRTAFRAPTYPTQDEAIVSMKTEAARAGADGLVNVFCMDQGRSRWSSSTEPAILCYGNAIRVKPGQG